VRVEEVLKDSTFEPGDHSWADAYVAEGLEGEWDLWRYKRGVEDQA